MNPIIQTIAEAINERFAFPVDRVAYVLMDTQSEADFFEEMGDLATDGHTSIHVLNMLRGYAIARMDHHTREFLNGSDIQGMDVGELGDYANPLAYIALAASQNLTSRRAA